MNDQQAMSIAVAQTVAHLTNREAHASVALDGETQSMPHTAYVARLIRCHGEPVAARVFFLTVGRS